MADEADKAIKTVKGISAAAWDKGLTAAKKRGDPFGQWLGRAIERQADVEADDQVIFPDERRQPEPRSAGQSAPSAHHGLTSSWEGIATLSSGLAAISEKPGCGGVATRMRALLDQHMAAMALAPLPRPRSGKLPGKLPHELGQTRRIASDAEEPTP